MRVLLPHEILHALSEHPFAFDSLIKGNMDELSRMRFWKHCFKLDPWKGHPASRLPLCKLIPIAIHNDGAEIYSDDEFCIWSLSSVFGAKGLIQDVLLHKFPFIIIAERHMRSEAEPKHYLPAGCPSERKPNRSNLPTNFFWGGHCQTFSIFLPKGLSAPNPVTKKSPPVPAQVKHQVNKTAAELFAWSIQCSMDGVAPAKGSLGRSSRVLELKSQARLWLRDGGTFLQCNKTFWRCSPNANVPNTHLCVLYHLTPLLK